MGFEKFEQQKEDVSAMSKNKNINVRTTIIPYMNKMNKQWKLHIKGFMKTITLALNVTKISEKSVEKNFFWLQLAYGRTLEDVILWCLLLQMKLNHTFESSTFLFFF